MSIVNNVAELLKIEDKSLMRAAIITANMTPFIPERKAIDTPSLHETGLQHLLASW